MISSVLDTNRPRGTCFHKCNTNQTFYQDEKATILLFLIVYIYIKRDRPSPPFRSVF